MNNLLAEINIGSLFTVVGIVAAIAVLFAALIVLVSRLTEIKTDEKEEKIKDLLSGANCGGCGYAGCADFAKALAEGRADISSCGPTSKDNKAAISALLGVEFSGETLCSFVHCNGGNAATETRRRINSITWAITVAHIKRLLQAETKFAPSVALATELAPYLAITAL